MAPKELQCFLFVCFFALGSATYCTYDSDCSYSKSCCDYVCRDRCFCSYDHQCGWGEKCCNSKCSSSSSCRSCTYDYECESSKKCCNSKCSSSSSSCSCSSDYQCDSGEYCCGGVCSSYCGWSGGSIAGAVIGTIIFLQSSFPSYPAAAALVARTTAIVHPVLWSSPANSHSNKSSQPK